MKHTPERLTTDQHEGQHGYDCAPCAEILTIRPEILNQPCGCPPVDSDILCPMHAAAPALLEALEDMVRIHPGGVEGDMCVGTQCLCNNARAAIKAAKGD